MKRREAMTDRAIRSPEELEALSFPKDGLLPVVAQDAETGEVMMVAFANREALERTIQTGEVHYWSRSRQEIWHKGATSGNRQHLVSLHADCDGDTILARIRPAGPACHTGEATCFGALRGEEATERPAENTERVESGPDETLSELWDVILDRDERRPEGSYTVRLLEDENLRLKKLGEELAELLSALARAEKERITAEAADLIYHLLVALHGSGVGLEGLLRELDARKT